MQPSRQSLESFLQRLKDGASTPEEIDLFRDWIASADLSAETESLTLEQLEVYKLRMHQQLMDTIKATPAPRIGRRSMWRIYAAAAAIVITVSAGILFLYLKARTTGQGAKDQLAFSVIRNDRNVVRKVTMPDGTIVWLNRNSQLEFEPHQYNQEQRFVRLSGEGYFEVTKDPLKPFIVATGNIHTRVLGTAFNIEAYQEESEIRISLVHGSVSLEDKARSVTAMLAPNQTIRYSLQTKDWQLMPMAVNNISAWTSGALVFNEVPLGEAIERIGSRYHLQLQYNKELLHNKRITAVLSVHDWQEALRNVLFVHGLQFHDKNGVVSILAD
ncbi:FecR family protein [Paraflavitalea pollutisoli]|uniref:FecR family protein n=1 Tax=Paraflavitalea pollutisoli TaxID=3034143 RepID=UPI0023EDDFC2|nr:FecR domain-containing protein [Paraflavitalea sp. H1-2-19X]